MDLLILEDNLPKADYFPRGDLSTSEFRDLKNVWYTILGLRPNQIILSTILAGIGFVLCVNFFFSYPIHFFWSASMSSIIIALAVAYILARKISIRKKKVHIISLDFTHRSIPRPYKRSLVVLFSPFKMFTRQQLSMIFRGIFIYEELGSAWHWLYFIFWSGAELGLLGIFLIIYVTIFPIPLVFIVSSGLCYSLTLVVSLFDTFKKSRKVFEGSHRIEKPFVVLVDDLHMPLERRAFLEKWERTIKERMGDNYLLMFIQIFIYGFLFFLITIWQLS